MLDGVGPAGKKALRAAIDELRADIERAGVGMVLSEVAGGFRLQTLPACGVWLRHLLEMGQHGAVARQVPNRIDRLEGESDASGREPGAAGGGDAGARYHGGLYYVLERVGSNRPVPVDVRLIAATNLNLDQAIESGEFREDLYYRLNVFPVEMPPLRRRVSDLPALLDELLVQHSPSGERTLRLTNRALSALYSYPWPGNIRELSNLVERLAILHPTGRVDVSDLPARYRETTVAADNEANEVMAAMQMTSANLKDHLQALEQAREAGSDVLLIDTAGRLQNKSDLMDELGKISAVDLVRAGSAAVGGKALLREALPGGDTVSSIYDYQSVAARRAGVQFEFVLVLGDHRHHAGVVRTRADLAEQDLVTAHEQLDAEQPAAAELRERVEARGHARGELFGERVLAGLADASPAVIAWLIEIIPSSLVDRYEILTDGASSVYGSDALAGVANIILRKDFEGLEVEAYVSARHPQALVYGRRFVLGPGGGSKIEARFSGPDPKVLRRISERAKAIMAADPGARDVPEAARPAWHFARPLWRMI